MEKDIRHASAKERMTQLATRLERGVRRAEAVQDSALRMLHDEAIPTSEIPFTVTDDYNVNHPVEDQRFDAQLNLSVLSETISERTLPILKERLAVVQSITDYAEKEEQLATHSARVTKMREQYEKGHFPAKRLEEAEERTEVLKAEHQNALRRTLDEQINHYEHRLQTMQEGLGQGKFTQEGVRSIAAKLETFKARRAKLAPEEETIFESTTALPVQESVVIAETKSEEIRASNLQTAHVDESVEERATRFYGSFYEIATTPRAEDFYTFLEAQIRSQNGSFRLNDLSQALYMNPDYDKDARSYISSHKKKMADRGWAITNVGRRGERLFRVHEVSEVLELENEEEETQLPLPIESSPATHEIDPGEESAPKRKFHEREILPSRWEALQYMASTPDWTTDDVIALLGPDKHGKPLFWNHALFALGHSLNMLYAKVRRDIATDDQLAVWNSLTAGLEESGKDILVTYRGQVLKEQLKQRREGQPSKPLIYEQAATEEPTFITPPESLEYGFELTRLDEDEVSLMGALITDLNGVMVRYNDQSVPFSVEQDVLDQYASQRKQFKRRWMMDETGKLRKFQQETLAKLRRMLQVENYENLNQLVDQHEGDAELLLLLLIENNELFDGTFLDFVGKHAEATWIHSKKAERYWNAPRHLPLFDSLDGETVEPQPETAPLPSHEGVIFEEPKSLRLERMLPSVRGDIRRMITLAHTNYPDKMSMAQLRGVNFNLGKIADYALEHKYLKGVTSGRLPEFQRADYILLQYLLENKQSNNRTILREPRLVRDLTDIIEQESKAYLASLEN